MAVLLDLPEEVLESGILPFLPWNDLLRCRRVCKTTKGVTDNYIRLNPKKAPEIELTDQTGKDLKAFIAIGIPTTKLFLNNPSGYHFFDKLDTSTLTKFATTYGPMIISLRLVEFSTFTCFNEWTFLEALSNLKTFEAGHFGFGIVPSIDQRQQIEFGQFMRAMTDPRFEGKYYPQNLTNIEVLKIGRNKQYWIGDGLNRFGLILRQYLNLDYISFPISSNFESSVTHPSHRSVHAFLIMLEKLSDSIISKSHVEGQKNLTMFDFITYHEERGMMTEAINEMHSELSTTFVIFAGFCTRFGVKLLNVNPAWYHQRTKTPVLSLPLYGHPVVSLVNLHACVFPLDMPNVERINICQTSRSNVGSIWNARRPNWPALKFLEINVNSKKAVETDLPTQDTALLFNFLLKDIVRDQLAELSLKFEDKKGKGGVAIPKMQDIASACPNLRKLRLVKWLGTNKQLTKLWSGMPGLEELALEYCGDLGNVAFVGEDVENPVFFRLENLKKLTLKGLDQMPKITDTLCSVVLAKMHLSHLIIGSDKPVEKITKVGIAALLEGKFAETIEKFPFHGWSLSTMSAEDFEGIGKRFRSFNML